MEESSELPLPDAFLDFLKANGLDPSIYTASDSTPRYIRYSKGFISSNLVIFIDGSQGFSRIRILHQIDILPMEVIMVSFALIICTTKFSSNLVY